MHQTFFPALKSTDLHITLTNADECHHIQHVLRINKGGSLGLLNGCGLFATGIITGLDKFQMTIKIQQMEERPPLMPEIHLLCAVPKKDRWEWLLEKGTELGATSITPLMTENSTVRWGEEAWKKKLKRQHSILISSAKQCSSIFLPELCPPKDFETFLNELSDSKNVLMPSLLEKTASLSTALQQMNSAGGIYICVGPEGDFSKEEYAAAEKKGVTMVTLGTQILRVETAALTAVATIRQIFI